MNRSCIIVGAGEFPACGIHIPKDAFVIAADGGLSYLEKMGRKADLILGDFDSLGRRPQGENVVAFSPEKDDTDMMLALKEALSRGFEPIIIYGGLGGRFDHSIANIQALSFAAGVGARAFLVGSCEICTVIKNSGISFPPGFSGLVSVFCLGEKAIGVDLKGLKYPLSGYTLKYDLPLGVSNEFCGEAASISVSDGMLLIIWEHCGDTEEIYNYGF